MLFTVLVVVICFVYLVVYFDYFGFVEFWFVIDNCCCFAGLMLLFTLCVISWFLLCSYSICFVFVINCLLFILVSLNFGLLWFVLLCCLACILVYVYLILFDAFSFEIDCLCAYFGMLFANRVLCLLRCLCLYIWLWVVMIVLGLRFGMLCFMGYLLVWVFCVVYFCKFVLRFDFFWGLLFRCLLLFWFDFELFLFWFVLNLFLDFLLILL